MSSFSRDKTKAFKGNLIQYSHYSNPLAQDEPQDAEPIYAQVSNVNKVGKNPFIVGNAAYQGPPVPPKHSAKTVVASKIGEEDFGGGARTKRHRRYHKLTKKGGRKSKRKAIKKKSVRRRRK